MTKLRPGKRARRPAFIPNQTPEQSEAIRGVFERRYFDLRAERETRESLIDARDTALRALVAWDAAITRMDEHRANSSAHVAALWKAMGNEAPASYEPDDEPVPPSESEIAEQALLERFRAAIAFVREHGPGVRASASTEMRDFLSEAEGWADDRTIAAIVYGNEFDEQQLKSLQVQLTGLRKSGHAWPPGVEAEKFYADRQREPSSEGDGI